MHSKFHSFRSRKSKEDAANRLRSIGRSGTFGHSSSLRDRSLTADLIERIDYPLRLSVPIPDYALPLELVSFNPKEDEVYKFFFKGTPKQLALRQLFINTPLTEEEMGWLREFREETSKLDNFVVPNSMCSLLPRVLLFNWRRFKQAYIQKSIDHMELMLNWRLSFFPIDDNEADLRTDLEKGIMYWVGRDIHMKPLLVINLARTPPNTPPERIKRLIIFCFEWAARYMLLPGKCETCSVLLDVRKLSIYEFPVNALSDMSATLTMQYPSRLDRMWILTDSIIIQAVWAVAKNFLTELQQDKIRFLRSNFEKELAKEYAMTQLENIHGGTRANIKCFYPFPIAPGPYGPAGYKGPYNYKAPSNCHESVDELTTWGTVWETDSIRCPLKWKKSIVDICHNHNVEPPPIPHRHKSHSRASSVSSRMSSKEPSVFDDIKNAVQKSFRSLSHSRSGSCASHPQKRGPSVSSSSLEDLKVHPSTATRVEAVALSKARGGDSISDDSHGRAESAKPSDVNSVPVLLHQSSGRSQGHRETATAFLKSKSSACTSLSSWRDPVGLLSEPLGELSRNPSEDQMDLKYQSENASRNSHPQFEAPSLLKVLTREDLIIPAPADEEMSVVSSSSDVVKDSDLYVAFYSLDEETRREIDEVPSILEPGDQFVGDAAVEALTDPEATDNVIRVEEDVQHNVHVTLKCKSRGLSFVEQDDRATTQKISANKNLYKDEKESDGESQTGKRHRGRCIVLPRRCRWGRS